MIFRVSIFKLEISLNDADLLLTKIAELPLKFIIIKTMRETPGEEFLSFCFVLFFNKIVKTFRSNYKTDLNMTGQEEEVERFWLSSLPPLCSN